MSDDPGSKGTPEEPAANAGVRRDLDALQQKIDEARTDPSGDSSSDGATAGRLHRVGLYLVAGGVALALIVVLVAVAVSSGGHQSHGSTLQSLDAYLTTHAPADSYVGVVTGAPDIVPHTYQTVAVASPADLAALQLKWVLVKDPPGNDPTTAAVLHSGVLVATVDKSVRLYELGTPVSPIPGTTTTPPTTTPPTTTPPTTTPPTTTPPTTTPPTTAPAVIPPITVAPTTTTTVPPTTTTTTTVPPTTTTVPPTTTTVPPTTTPPTTAPPTTAPAVTTPPTTAPTTLPSTLPAAKGPPSVAVVSGDSFWSIAARVATARLGGSPSNAQIASIWQALIAANSSRLVQPGNPNLIYPGQVFVVPPP